MVRLVKDAGYRMMEKQEKPIDWNIEGPKWKELALWLEKKYYLRIDQVLWLIDNRDQPLDLLNQIKANEAGSQIAPASFD